MENNQQPNPEQGSKKPDLPVARFEWEDTENKKNAESEAMDSNTPKNEPTNIIVKVENPQKDGWTIGNRIALAALIVSALLFYFTYELFKQATIQSQAAIKAANAAEGAVAEYRRASNLAEKTFESNNESSNRSLDLSAQSLKAQISSIKKTASQFEISNRAFIQLTDFAVDSLDEGQKPIIRFKIVNTGKFPARIISIGTFLGRGDALMSKEEIKQIILKNGYKIKDAANFILPSNPIIIPQSVYCDDAIVKEMSNAIKAGTQVFYLAIEIKYVNFLTKEHYLKHEIYRIKGTPISDTELMDGKEGTF